MPSGSTPPGSLDGGSSKCMTEGRRVVRSDHFLENAMRLYPPGGTAEGQRSFELFESGPLAAIEELFSRAFEEQPEAAAGIRFALTHQVPVFPAMVFYAALGRDDAVEIVDVTIDEEYFGLIQDDSTD